MLKVPLYVEKAGIMGAPIKYKWSEEIAVTLSEAENARLQDAFDEANFKAKFAMGLAVTEWIVWRFKGHADTEDALKRIEAGWASMVHPSYAQNLDPELTVNNDTENVKGPLELSMDLLSMIYDYYGEGSIYLSDPVTRQALLAAHVLPKKQDFQGWLSKTARRASGVFPRQVDYDEETELYDASSEAPVPREFFDEQFKYSEALAQKAWKAFLQSVDPKQNPYLSPPKKSSRKLTLLFIKICCNNF